MNPVMRTFADGAVVATRNLIKIKRVPDILVWTLMSPIVSSCSSPTCSAARSRFRG